jgi:DNA primase
MLRVQRVAAGRKMRICIAQVPAGEDPAELIAAEGGARRFADLVEAAIDLPAFQVGLALERADVTSPAERDKALGEVAPILAAMGETASRDDLVRRVAERLDLEPAMVMGRLVAARPPSGSGRGSPQPAENGSRLGSGPRPGRELTSRERRERALLAMCIALPGEGHEYLGRLSDQHLSASGARAAEWLRRHPEDPASNLPRDDDELAALITELAILARDEPASAEAMELNFLLLEQRRLERLIGEAGEKGEYDLRAALSRERAVLVEHIAHAERR